jgi:hypothetical protein
VKTFLVSAFKPQSLRPSPKELSLSKASEGGREREREHPEKILKPAQILFFVIDQASTSFSPDFFIDIAMQR